MRYCTLFDDFHMYFFVFEKHNYLSAYFYWKFILYNTQQQQNSGITLKTHEYSINIFKNQ